MAPTFCSQCGAALRTGASFCGGCGAAVESAVPALPWKTDTPDAGAAQRTYAGFWIRFAALFIDGIVVSIVTNPLTLAIGQGFSVQTTENARGEVTGVTWDFDATRLALTALISILIPGVYYTVAISRWGQTFGALALSVRVEHPDGTLLTPASAAVRWLGTFVSGLALGLGYLWMIWDGRKQTWHDKMAGSVVRRVKRRGEI